MRTFAMLLSLLVVITALPCMGQARVIASWDFNQGEGDTLTDVSGNGHDGDIHGATWSEGKFGGGLHFDGEDDYVQVPASPDLDATDALSVEAWAKLEHFGEVKDRVIVSRADHPLAYGGWGLNWGYGPDFWYGQDGDYRFMGRLEPGEWHHIVLVSSLGGHLVTLYLDGKVANQHVWGKPLVKSEFPLWIGRRGQGHNFSGWLDEIAVYDGALTPEQIAARYRGEPLPRIVAKPPPGDAPEIPGEQVQIIGAWSKYAPTGLEHLRYENLFIALRNSRAEPLAVTDTWLDACHAEEGQMSFAGATTQIAFAGTVPTSIPPGGVGVLNIKLMRSAPLPESLTVVMREAEGGVIRTVTDFAEGPARIASVAFDENLQGAWLYLRGNETCELESVSITGSDAGLESPAYAPGGDRLSSLSTSVDVSSGVPVGGVAENALVPMHLTFSEPLTVGTPVILSAQTDHGASHAFIYAFPASFPIGMYRVQRQTVGADYEPPEGREWLQEYMDTFAIAGRDSGQAPDEWLEDCRRHYIDTLVPDYVLRGGDPSIAARFGLSVVPYGVAVNRYRDNPAISAWYLADEPRAEPVASVLAKFEKLREADRTRPIVVTINPPVWPRGVDFDFVDVGYQDTYPIPGGPLDTITHNVSAYRDLLAPRPVCFIPQSFRKAPNMSAGWSRFPTPDEERLMVLMSLAAGARGEVYFAYNVEPHEPVEGCGVSNAPEAQALWAEIGRLNLQLRTLAPLLARSCFIDTRRDGDVEVARLALGSDTIACIVLNHDYEYTRETFIPHPKQEVTVAVPAPEWLSVANAFEMTDAGPVARTYRDGALTLDSLDVATIMILTADGNLKERLSARRKELMEAVGEG